MFILGELNGEKVYSVLTMESIKTAINEIIADTIGRRGHNAPAFDDETKLEALGFDSLDIMEIIVQTEGKLGVRVPNNKIEKIYTVGDLYALFKIND